ncbi:MAG: hypothetical protein EP334_05020 [Gammaproteobacteria bacterium]|nr:MAG: hypothetical protein EP334_05020 [Gammaproteobacteria bacterium]
MSRFFLNKPLRRGMFAVGCLITTLALVLSLLEKNNLSVTASMEAWSETGNRVDVMVSDSGQASITEEKARVVTQMASSSPDSGAVRIGCDGFAEKPLREIPAGGIVKWTDEQGITHYEDYHATTAPVGMQLVTRFPDTKEYFSLNLEVEAGALPASFRAAITRRAVWIYEYYRTLLDERHLSRAEVHLVVHSNRADYEIVRNQYVGERSEDVPGFYIVTGNRAEILHEGHDEQTLKVMTHEVVHVINNQLFGLLPRWLNEGLATYMESLERDEQRPSTAKERLRIIRKQVGVPLLGRVNVRQLLDTEKRSWSPEQRAIYYPFSQLLTTYLLQPENRVFSRLFFNYLASHKCEEPNVAERLQADYPGGINGLSADFERWLRS